MCGFVAIFSPDGARMPEAGLRTRLSDGLAVLQHRGPDGVGTWVSDRGHVGLGHARLSIIDAAGGRQPLSSSDGRIQAVVNGEFYDYRRIRSDLQGRGHVFQTGSDSEILIHLYRAHGVACLKHLRGEFAFVLYDAERDQLFMGRDRFGVKPLFFAERSGEILVASEIKALLAAGVLAVWDTEAYLTRAAGLGGRTLFKGITELAPGHVALFDAGGLRRERYWDLDFAASGHDPALATPADAVAAVRERLREAVELRLVADVPIAFYLSGGLDSSAVLAMAAAQGSRDLVAFNLSFVDGGEYDERRYAHEAAAHLGARLTTIDVTSDSLADHFTDSVWHNEGTLFNAHGIAKLILSRAVRAAGFKAVLTGEGADEVFAGYPHFRKDLLLAASGRWTGPAWADVERARQGVVGAFLNAACRERLGDVDAIGALLAALDATRLHERHPVHAAMYLWAKTRLPAFVLTTLGDRMEMANGVEGRVPFLDHVLVETVMRLPLTAKIDGRSQKHVLREAVRPLLPAGIANRRKHYFEAPPVLASPTSRLAQRVQEELRSEALKDLPFFDPASVIAALDALPRTSPAAVAALDPAMMEIASLCVLNRLFKPSTQS